MKKQGLIYLTLCVLSIFMLACGGETKSEATAFSGGEEPASQEQASTSQTDSLAEVKAEQQRLKNKAIREEIAEQKAKVTQAVGNTLSPYRYVVSTPEFENFAKILKKSSLSKHIHNAGVTLLAPTNEALENAGNFRGLAQNGTTEEIDEFVAQYVIDQIILRKKIEETGVLTNHAGVTLKVSRNEDLLVEMVKLGEDEIVTENGVVIPLEGLYHNP